MEPRPTNIEEARLNMHRRILRYPFGGNPEDCPLHDVRTWPVEKRLTWLESKPDKEVVGLYDYHIKCLEQKSAARSDRSLANSPLHPSTEFPCKDL